MAKMRYRWMRNPWWRVAVGTLAVGAGVMALTQETTCNGVPMEQGDSCVRRTTSTVRSYDKVASRQKVVGAGVALVGLVSVATGANSFRKRARDRQLLDAAALGQAHAQGTSPVPGMPPPLPPQPPMYSPPQPASAPPPAVAPLPSQPPVAPVVPVPSSMPPPLQWGPPGG